MATQIEEFAIEARGLRFPARALGDGPLVLLLHGFPDCVHSFDAQLPALAEAGYRAVSIAMRGYARENQPADGDYTQLALAADVLAVAEALDLGPAHLVGHDWGAAVAYTAAAMAPECFASLTTMAVPHSGRFLAEISRYPRQLRLSWYMGLFQLPLLPERVIQHKDFAFLRWLWRQWSPGWEFDEDEFSPVATCFAEAGVVRAALAYYRAAISSDILLGRGQSTSILDVPVPTLAMTGECDGCIAADVFEAMSREEDFSGGLELRRIDGAGHFLHRERPAAINDELIAWLAANG